MLGLADRPRRVILANARRAGDDRLGRPFRHEDGRLAAALNDHAQHPPVEVVGQLGELAIGGQVGRLGRAGQDCGVKRILEARLEVAVEVGELQGTRRFAGVVLVDPDGLHQLELAQRQGACLVGAQDRDAAEVLDGRKALDQDAVCGQGARPAGQIEGDDRRQQLGRQADRKGDGEEQRFEERPVQSDVHGEYADNEDQRDPADQHAEGADAVLEVGLGGPLGESAGNRPIARLCAGGGDLGQPGAAHDARPEEGQPGPILVLARIEIARARVLERGGRLAGERRLVHEQVVPLQQTGIRGNDVAGAQDHHVAANDVADEDLLLLTVSDHGGAQCQASLERGHGGLGAGLLDESQESAHGHDREDDPRLHAIADGEADQAGGDEDQDQRTGELAHEHGQRSAATFAAEGVGAVLAKSLGRLGRGQTGGRAAGRGRRGRCCGWRGRTGGRRRGRRLARRRGFPNRSRLLRHIRMVSGSRRASVSARPA